MAGLRIDQLHWPNSQYRVDLLDPAFETLEQANERDALHAKMIRKTARLSGGPWGVLASDLADRIDPGLSPDLPESLASARYMRDLRIRFTGNVHQLVDNFGVEDVVRVDIIKPGLVRDLNGFLDEHPGRAMNELRTDFRRAGMANCEGFLVGAFHNEFDPVHQTFQGHGHFVIGGEYVKAVENLRRFPSYRPTEWVKRPIRVKRELTNLPHALSYLLKAYWLARPALSLGANGAFKRPRQGQRIPEPYHTQVLMWLDQFRLSDLTLLTGLSIRKSGLVIRR